MNRSISEKWFARLSAGLTIIVFLGTVAYKQLDLGKLNDVLTGISATVTIDLLVWWGFSIWAWKWQIFSGWLVEIPNLNGTWRGQLHSTWKDKKTGRRIKPIRAILTIRQTLTKISCVMRTDEMTSRSLSEGFRVDGGSQVCELTYLYSSEPIMTAQHRSPNHYGAVRLEVAQSSKGLKGVYWTQRDTKGDIDLEFCSDKLIERVEEAFQ